MHNPLPFGGGLPKAKVKNTNERRIEIWQKVAAQLRRCLAQLQLASFLNSQPMAKFQFKLHSAGAGAVPVPLLVALLALHFSQLQRSTLHLWRLCSPLL